jgi:hypothetical protein
MMGSGSLRYRRKDIDLIMERSRSMAGTSWDWYPGTFLPLDDAAYAVLLALTGPALTEEALMDALSANAEFWKLRRGTLRSALLALAGQGLVRERTDSAADEGPYYVTELGQAVLLAESGRRRRGTDVA